MLFFICTIMWNRTFWNHLKLTVQSSRWNVLVHGQLMFGNPLSPVQIHLTWRQEILEHCDNSSCGLHNYTLTFGYKKLQCVQQTQHNKIQEFCWTYCLCLTYRTKGLCSRIAKWVKISTNILIVLSSIDSSTLYIS